MRNVLALLALTLIPSLLLAQDATDKINSNAVPPSIVKPARDFVMLQFNYNTWLQKPDSVKIKTLGYSFNAYLCYDFPIKKTKLSFAAGVGINTSVVYLNQEVIMDTGSVAPYASQAAFWPDSTHFKRYKFVTTYVTAPFELRYFASKYNRNKGFKAAIGMEIGTLVVAPTPRRYCL